MTDTVVSSATKEVVIGFDRPFVMIGERINPTGRKILAEEMAAGDYSRVERDAVAQVEAMKSALQAAGKKAEFKIYPGAPHAFHADYRPSYRKEAAEDGWKRMTAWLKANNVLS